MVISQRTIAKKDFKRDYQRVRVRVQQEIARRVATGVPYMQVLHGLFADIMSGRWNVSNPSVPGTSRDQQSSDRAPSVVRIRQTLETLQAEMRTENTASTSSSTDRVNPVRQTDLGRAVRNLQSVFSGLTPSSNRTPAHNSRSWRSESLNTLRVATESVRRTSTDRARRPNAIPLSRDPDIPAYQYNPSNFRSSELTLKQAMKVMITFDFDRYYERIKSTLCTFSLRIYGLDNCAIEDLRLAVFLFIEQHFSFQPAIELCVRHISDPYDPNVVGVLFERNATTKRILDNRNVLDDTQYQVSQNFQADWIIWNYDG